MNLTDPQMLAGISAAYRTEAGNAMETNAFIDPNTRLEAHARERPRKVFIESPDQGTRISFGEFEALTRRFANFLAACARENVAFKATAGLHHPLRCYRPLTYSADGPSGWMYGFLNVFTAAVLARRGIGAAELEPMLVAESLARLPTLDDPAEVTAARRDFAISFGSCSFEEPVADLKALRLI
jgi:acyl-CoA synthetase (AMP-forming)/AMP-acid ligase II